MASSQPNTQQSFGEGESSSSTNTVNTSSVGLSQNSKTTSASAHKSRGGTQSTSLSASSPPTTSAVWPCPPTEALLAGARRRSTQVDDIGCSPYPRATQQGRSEEITASPSLSVVIKGNPNAAGPQRSTIHSIELAPRHVNLSSPPEKSFESLPTSQTNNEHENADASNIEVGFCSEPQHQGSQGYSTPRIKLDSEPRMRQASFPGNNSNESTAVFFHLRFCCPECPDSFLKKGNRNRHLRYCHQKQKREFPCELCSASYKSKGARKLHLDRAHSQNAAEVPLSPVTIKEASEQAKFLCDFPGCENGYTELWKFLEHVETHESKKRNRSEKGNEGASKSNLKVRRTQEEQ